jgi:tRNA (cmo5U34)-methyltransferase
MNNGSQQALTPMNVDNLFLRVDGKQDFRFDEQVVDVFDDMVTRSVPFYMEVQRTMAELAAMHATNNSKVYDLGCSLGTTAIEVAKRVNPTIEVVGIDSSEPMIASARRQAKALNLATPLSFRTGNIIELPDLPDASVAILSLTLQFLRPIQRPALIKRVYDSLQVGGALLVFEKSVVADPDLNRLFIDKYYDFKMENGYSEVEIARKRTALENVLIPFTVEENIQMFTEAGFRSASTFFQWYNFAAFLVVK